jgi:hypothetical protein
VTQQINLFNPIFLKQRKVFTAVAMAQAVGLLLVGLGAFGVYQQQSVKSLRAQLAAVENQHKIKQGQLAAISVQFAPRQQDPELRNELANLELQARTLRHISGVLTKGQFGNTRGYADYFRAFARQRVDGLWLTGLKISGAGDDMTVNGRALDAALVPGFLGKLAKEPVLHGKTFASMTISLAETRAPAPVAGAGTAGPAAEPPRQLAFVDFTLQAQPSEERK